MKKFVFYDTDVCGDEEYDIRGENYKILIYTCCRYSSVLYLICLEPDLHIANELKDFEISRPDNIPADQRTYHGYCEQHYYKVCPELCNVLLKVAGGIFEWLTGWGFKNPENPVFYRSDGSVFFTSDIHNGVCAILPREDENVEKLLNAVAWCDDDSIRFWPRI